MQQPATLRKETRKNIADAAELVAEMFKPCLGPVGRVKLVTDKDGIWLSDDPSLLLKKMEVQHPAAKAMSEAASTISGPFGDGACSFLIIVAELLKGGVNIVDKKTHPNTVVNGWRLALDMCLDSPSTLTIDTTNEAELIKVAKTILSESSFRDCEKLAPLIVQAVLALPEEGRADLNSFSVEMADGGAVEDSFVVKGIALPHEFCDPLGPKLVKDARIACVRGEINEWKPPTPRADTKILITQSGGISGLHDARYRFLENLSQSILRSGANVLFLEKGIDPVAVEYLSRKGIVVIRRFVIEQMNRLALATGSKLVYDMNALSPADLGYAERVEARLINGKEWTFVEGGRGSRAATFVVKGGSRPLLVSSVRLVKRAVKTVKEAQLSRRVVYGGGAWEMALATKVRAFSEECEGRQQLALNVFADALEAIPATLAKNAGMDALSALADLRAAHAEGKFSFGIDSRTRRLADMGKLGVLDPFSVKQRTLLTSFGIGAMLIRIDMMIVLEQLWGDARTVKMMEKTTDPEKIEQRRKDYGGMEKLEQPRWRPTKKRQIGPHSGPI